MSRVKQYDGTNWVESVDTVSTQVITGQKIFKNEFPQWLEVINEGTNTEEKYGMDLSPEGFITIWSDDAGGNYKEAEFWLPSWSDGDALTLVAAQELGSLAYLSRLDKISNGDGSLTFSYNKNATINNQYDLLLKRTRTGGLSDLSYYFVFPTDETSSASSPLKFATRSWVNSHALSLNSDGDLYLDIGDQSNSYGSYRAEMCIRAEYDYLEIGTTDGYTRLRFTDKNSTKYAIRFKHHIQMANSSIKCKFCFTNDVKTAYTTYNQLAYAIYYLYFSGYYMRTNAHSIEASGYDLGASPSRIVYCVYATGTTTIKVGESNGSDYTMSSSSFSITDDVEIV